MFPVLFTFKYLFNKYMYWIFLTRCRLSVYSSSKCSLFHNSNVFGSCIIHMLFIYSANIGTEYFKHGIYSPFFFSSKCSLSHNSNVVTSCIIHILYTECAKIKKKNNSGAKRWNIGCYTAFLKRKNCIFSSCYLPVHFLFVQFISVLLRGNTRGLGLLNVLDWLHSDTKAVTGGKNAYCF